MGSFEVAFLSSSPLTRSLVLLRSPACGSVSSRSLKPIRVQITASAPSISPLPPSSARSIATKSSPRARWRRSRLAILGTLSYILSLLFRNRHAVHAKAATTTGAASATHTVARFSIRDRLAFWMGEFLMWNPFARVFALILATILFIVLGGWLFKLADPKGTETKSPVWTSFRAFCNPLEDDFEGNSLRATSALVAGVGLVVFAILVGMVTDSVESAVRGVDGGSSRVTMSGHTLICGWNHRVSPILKDISVVEPRTKVVVLASESEKEEMMGGIRNEFTDSERKKFRLFYRPGTSVLQEDLNKVAANYASKILLVGDNTEKEDADRKVLSRALALREHLPDFRGDIVAELNDPRDEKILKSVLAETAARSIQTVNSDRLLFRFMAQAIRQPGLPDVVGRLMGDDPNTVFHVEPVSTISPQLVGRTFSSLGPASIPGTIVCGYIDDVSGNVKLGLGSSDHVLSAKSQLLLLGRPDQKSLSRGGVQKKAMLIERLKVKKARSDRRKPESVLVCGWRNDMHDMLSELDLTLSPRSKIVILDDDAPMHLMKKFKNVSVFIDKRRPDRFEHLADLLGEKETPYDHILLLSSALRTESTKDNIEEDSKGLATLMYLNELVEKQLAGKTDTPRTTITIEFSNPRVAQIAKNDRAVTNVILPENLSAKIASQTVRNSNLNALWKELLSQEGREVYFRSPNLYVPENQMISFAHVADIAQETRDEVAIGFISSDKPANINPRGVDRDNPRKWRSDDLIICLAHE